jgi:hypothetical protein
MITGIIVTYLSVGSQVFCKRKTHNSFNERLFYFMPGEYFRDMVFLNIRSSATNTHDRNVKQIDIPQSIDCYNDKEFSHTNKSLLF